MTIYAEETIGDRYCLDDQSQIWLMLIIYIKRFSWFQYTESQYQSFYITEIKVTFLGLPLAKSLL